MAAEFLKIERRDHIATVSFDRPPVNALTDQVFAEIRDTFSTVAEDWDTRAVIFGSAVDRAFCAGADLKTRGTEKPPVPLPTDARKIARDAMWAVLDCPVPVIAAVNGPALGGGLCFAAVCDIIVASERATFGCPEIGVGLLGAGSHMKRMIGPYRMRELYFTGRAVSAAEMYEMGGLSRVVPHAELDQAARQIATEIASKSPAAIRLAKESLNRTDEMPFKDAYRTEQDYTARLSHYEDSKEAMTAFREKRPPIFKGG
ncbi:MAG: enoyl-CoA hydratase-related protein [Candidatus Binatia bacterium]|nr:enoyl-CoA hydratase-related protein [Candidatus Binatia bacterium]